MAEKIDKSKVKAFIAKWTGRGKEDEDDRSYWIDLFQDVFAQTGVTDRLSFQKKVVGSDGNTKRIDVYVPETKVIIEQKSLGIALDKPQAGHSGMTPYEQAKMYNDHLPFSERARWIVISNFVEIWIYDMEKKRPTEDIIKVSLSNLESDYPMLQFLYDDKVEQIRRELKVSQEAGDRIGKIYDALLSQYPGEPTEDEYRSLNLFCVRLVFCYYAEDAGLFGKYQFRDYMASFNTKHLRNGLKDLFRVLDTKEEERDRNDEPELLAFPYVNGGLFADRNIVIPQIDENTHKIMVETSDFNWSSISPTIFGAVFESTLNQETRRKGGMHYTSIENIHKVIDPLFLDDLKEEYAKISEMKQPNMKRQKLKEYQNKLGALKFFDPACGSGNFLTETYLSLRKIENEVIKDICELDKSINPNQIALGDFGAGESPIKVDLSQFYGIEINDFAVAVSKTALWIAESQMLKETQEIVYHNISFLPLKSYVSIVEGNALLLDWEDVVDHSDNLYIMGNPPFVGARLMSPEQKNDIDLVFGKDWKNAGNLDYVSCWYKKSADFMINTNIQAALVSTNSVTQGESVATLWKDLFSRGLSINFAHRTFRWDSEASIKAHVHCVIVGFSYASKEKYIFEDNQASAVKNINAYLLDAPSVFIESRKTPICDVPQVVFGNMPNDSGFLSDYDDETKNAIVKKHPESEKLFRKFLGATEFLHSKTRWCLWLKGVSPKEYSHIPPVREAVEAVERMRASSKRDATKKLADIPMLFGEIRQPDGNYLIIPRHSSEKRRYIPIGYETPDVICGDANLMLPNAGIYEFGIMNSSVHMAWMSAVCGRIKSDYRYSINVVYNNFPWCNPTDAQKKAIEKTANEIIDARNLYPNDSLSDLYEPTFMPPELRKAHEANDKAVLKAYGFAPDMEEAEIVAELMKMYQKLTEGEK